MWKAVIREKGIAMEICAEAKEKSIQCKKAEEEGNIIVAPEASVPCLTSDWTPSASCKVSTLEHR